MHKYRIKVAVILSFFTLAALAESEKALVNGKLAICPDKPNCVSTETGDLAAISFATHKPEQAWALLQTSIVEQGGNIEKMRENYLWASFQTSVFKFTDDLEARLDKDNQLIQLRSASRTGYYDFNVNRKRLNRLIDAFSLKLNSDKLHNIHE
ncbi:MAG: DUF1499 domain-containing protein [Methyloprofundus sp.]|nr:DUF1499 domain-containing protein [Methyloprofundus sp.]MBW6452494.1 DUF1499 domain-containing protein [Methyloprofundus sp.]